MTKCWTAAATIFWQHFFYQIPYGLAFLDISTGEFFTAEGDREYADKLLLGFKPAEVIFQRHHQKNSRKNLAPSTIPTRWMNGSGRKVCGRFAAETIQHIRLKALVLMQ
jgi:DNA mismatch repair ATPase MutS